jgi:hypothetical protein
MTLSRPSAPRDLIEFLRREAPSELERMQSISRLVSSYHEEDATHPGPSQFSYSAWLEERFAIFAILPAA